MGVYQRWNMRSSEYIKWWVQSENNSISFHTFVRCSTALHWGGLSCMKKFISNVYHFFLNIKMFYNFFEVYKLLKHTYHHLSGFLPHDEIVFLVRHFETLKYEAILELFWVNQLFHGNALGKHNYFHQINCLAHESSVTESSRNSEYECPASGKRFAIT